MSPSQSSDERFDAQLTAFLDHEAGRAEHVRGVVDAAELTRRIRGGPRSAVPTRPLLGGLRLAATAALFIALLTGTLWLLGGTPNRLGPTPSPSPTTAVTVQPTDLLATIRGRGAFRMAVRPDFPQAQAGGFNGYDVDVVNALADRIGLTVELQIRSVDEMLQPSAVSDIDAAMPSDVVAAWDPERFLASDPYYHWPVYLLVSAASEVTTAAGLAGGTVCVMAGSSGEAWLAGRYTGPSSTAIATTPANVSTRRESTTRDCLAALERGEVDALISATLSNADFATRSLRPLGGPVLTEPRSIVAQRAGPDPTAFIDEVDRALSEMRTDGTLVSFSQSRFGGNDLTSPSTP